MCMVARSNDWTEDEKPSGAKIEDAEAVKPGTAITDGGVLEVHKHGTEDTEGGGSEAEMANGDGMIAGTNNTLAVEVEKETATTNTHTEDAVPPSKAVEELQDAQPCSDPVAGAKSSGRDPTLGEPASRMKVFILNRLWTIFLLQLYKMSPPDKIPGSVLSPRVRPVPEEWTDANRAWWVLENWTDTNVHGGTRTSRSNIIPCCPRPASTAPIGSQGVIVWFLSRDWYA
jgi:hypothetical protein